MKQTEKTYKYTVVIEPQEPSGYFVYVPSLPGCFSQGQTIEEALSMIKDASELYIETLEDLKEPIPKGNGTIISDVELTRPGK
jgi:antitoxin HicB